MDLIEGNLTDPIGHWYYAHKLRSITKFTSVDLTKAELLVDVGAGSALFSLELLRRYPHLHVVAIDTGYDFVERKDSHHSISYRNNGQHISGDLYLFTDVLEHVLNDVDMLKKYVDDAPLKSKFVITVPAFMALWSGHDVYLKHYRRYRKKEIESVVEEAGLGIVKSLHLYSVLFPVVWILRRLPKSQKVSSQLKDHGKFVNCVILQSLKLDFLLSRILPLGISILVIAEKGNS